MRPTCNWDDYRGRDIKGSIVLIFEGEPAPDDPKSPFDGLVTSEYSISLRKALAAQAQGASAVLFVNPRSPTRLRLLRIGRAAVTGLRNRRIWNAIRLPPMQIGSISRYCRFLPLLPSRSSAAD